VFYRPRPFELKEFKAYMLAQSAPFAETIDLARALSRTGRYRLMTINNESDESWRQVCIEPKLHDAA